MKRTGNLFDQITDMRNIRLAWLKTLRGKRKKKDAVLFSRNVERNLAAIQRRFISGEYGFGKYHTFTVTDPKRRTIHAVPFDERIMHHAIMNVLEPVFERQFVFHCYACRKGKGLHSAVAYASRQCHRNKWFLKLDVTKYFDSIDHGILKQRLASIIKDVGVLLMLYAVIDSYVLRIEEGRAKGVPIGNLTSQFFANLYLSVLDHYIIEQLKPRGFVRYMDDFVLFGDHKDLLNGMHKVIVLFCNENLRVSLHDKVLGRTSAGVAFLGYLVRDDGIHLLRRTRKRMHKKIKDINNEYLKGVCAMEKAAARITSVMTRASPA